MNDTPAVPMKQIYAFTTLRLGDEHSLEVYMWREQSDLQAFKDDRLTHIEDENPVWALYTGLPYKLDIDENKRAAGQPLIGQLHVVKDNVNAGVVAHEMTHLALDWVSMWDLELIDDWENPATLIGNVTNDFYTWFWEVMERE